MKSLRISNTGKFNYHLKILAELLGKGEDGKYQLTEKGISAAQLLLNFPAEKPIESKNVNIQNILLIGAIGFALTLLNPAVLEGFIGVLLVAGLWLYILTTIYMFIVPGTFMWLLSIKRMRTHDFRDLVKPPFSAILLLTCLVALLAFLHWHIGLKLLLIPEGMNDGQATYTGLIVWVLPFAGLLLFNRCHIVRSSP